MKNLNENILRIKSLMVINESTVKPKDFVTGKYYYVKIKDDNGIDSVIIHVTNKDNDSITHDLIDYNSTQKKRKEIVKDQDVDLFQFADEKYGFFWEESTKEKWDEVLAYGTDLNTTPTAKSTETNVTQPTNTTTADQSNLIILAFGKGSDTYKYKKKDGKFYIQNENENEWKEVTDANVIKSIKEKYLPDTLTIESPNNFTENQLKFWKIFLRDYKSYITDSVINVNDDGLINYVYANTNKDNVEISWYFESDGSFYTLINDKYQFSKIVDDKIVFRDEKFSDLKNPENLDRPYEEKKDIDPSKEYIKFNVFSSIADDIYRDLIEDKISNVSFSHGGSVYYNDNNELNHINFGITIDGKDGDITFNEDGVKLEVDNVQVKPIWDDKILKYRPFNANEKKAGNEWMKTQPELKLESFQIRFKQLI